MYLKPLVKTVLIPSGLTAAASATDAAVHKAKKSAAGGLKTSLKRVIQKTTEVTSDLIGNKTAHKITKLLKNSQQINSETVTNEHDKEISTENHVCLEERQEIIDELRLKL